MQLLRLDVVHMTLVVGFELCTEVLKTKEVGIETSATYLVAAGFCHNSLTEACEQRTHHKHAAS